MRKIVSTFTDDVPSRRTDFDPGSMNGQSDPAELASDSKVAASSFQIEKEHLVRGASPLQQLQFG